MDKQDHGTPYIKQHRRETVIFKTVWVRHSHGHGGQWLLRDGARPGEPGVHCPEGTPGGTRAEGMRLELRGAREGSWVGTFSGRGESHLSGSAAPESWPPPAWGQIARGQGGTPGRTRSLCSPRAGTCAHQPDQSQGDRLQTSRRWAGRS